MRRGNVQRGSPGYLASRSRVPVKNASGSNTIPAFGLVVPTGSESTTGAITVDRPSADNVDVYVNGPSPIPPGGYGVASRTWPLYAAYNTGATPAPGQTWGAAANSYLLTTGKTGFVIQGTPAQSRVLIAPTQSGGAGGGGTGAGAILTVDVDYTTLAAAGAVSSADFTIYSPLPSNYVAIDVGFKIAAGSEFGGTYVGTINAAFHLGTHGPYGSFNWTTAGPNVNDQSVFTRGNFFGSTSDNLILNISNIGTADTLNHLTQGHATVWLFYFAVP